ncbi:FecR family protein [Parapedobacter sp. 2B3]|uniref:FecR family protein n=1 Tax=Parapedobacter sp. 2B3 TaxID=3342381 RepID=UPI0035B658EB
MENIFHKLAKKILRGSATDAERHFMDTYYDAFDNIEGREEVLTSEEQTTLRNQIDKRIQIYIQRKNTVRFRKWLPYAAAAIILAAVGTWAFFLYNREKLPTDPILAAEEILPGGHRATLSLADGRVIDLSETQTGIVIAEDNITYNSGDTLLLKPSETLMLTTPKGGIYQITLSDGTNVWLNAASTLTYPSRFDDAERVVRVSGEAYFAVVKDKSRPFKVNSSGQTVEVRGTEFNISAYPAENETKTTLVEGKVKISNLESQISNLLKPGEQAVISGSTMNIAKVDVVPYTAWKDGFFYFDNVPPRVAIEQVARWYDLEVSYEGNMPATFVFGMVDRAKPLSAVLNSFAKSGLNFEIRQNGSKKQLLVSENK